MNGSGGTSPYTYVWDNGQTDASAANLIAGVYAVTITDANQCTFSNSYPVTEPDLLAITTDIIPATCLAISDGQITIDVTGGTSPYSYSIEGQTPVSNNYFNGLTGDSTYNFTITDANNCTISGTGFVSAPPPLSVIFDPDEVEISLGETVNLMPDITPFDSSYTYVWSEVPGLSFYDIMNPDANPTVTSSYQLTVFDGPCPYDDVITVHVNNDLSVFVPNVFSPDGNEINDVLKVIGPAIASIDFTIYNRWGEKVFSSTDQNVGWDGTYKGKKAEPGAYVYFLEATFIDQNKKSLKGSITIVK